MVQGERKWLMMNGVQGRIELGLGLRLGKCVL